MLNVPCAVTALRTKLIIMLQGVDIALGETHALHCVRSHHRIH